MSSVSITHSLKSTFSDESDGLYLQVDDLNTPATFEPGFFVHAAVHMQSIPYILLTLNRITW